MATVLRSLCAALLCAAMTLTGASLASARAGDPVAGFMVICADGGAALVAVGPDGAPLESGSSHHCPDCVLHFAMHSGPSAPMPQAPADWRLESWSVTVQNPEMRRRLHARARGPPVS